MLLMCFSESPCPSGFDVKLDPISVEMMDSGTWYWKYTVDGVHVKLNMVEL
jgi:UTP---glucose-1-phosphate uridylyltransferase